MKLNFIYFIAILFLSSIALVTSFKINSNNQKYFTNYNQTTEIENQDFATNIHEHGIKKSIRSIDANINLNKEENVGRKVMNVYKEKRGEEILSSVYDGIKKKFNIPESYKNVPAVKEHRINDLYAITNIFLPYLKRNFPRKDEVEINYYNDNVSRIGEDTRAVNNVRYKRFVPIYIDENLEKKNQTNLNARFVNGTKVSVEDSNKVDDLNYARNEKNEILLYDPATDTVGTFFDLIYRERKVRQIDSDSSSTSSIQSKIMNGLKNNEIIASSAIPISDIQSGKEENTEEINSNEKPENTACNQGNINKNC